LRIQRRILKISAGFQNPARDFKIQCGILKTSAGFRKPTRDLRIQRGILKISAGFQNPARDFKIQCGISKTNAGFENPAQDFENQCRFSESSAGFQNSVRDSKNQCGISKTNAGFENPPQDFENQCWFLETSTGFQNSARNFENWCPFSDFASCIRSYALDAVDLNAEAKSCKTENESPDVSFAKTREFFSSIRAGIALGDNSSGLLEHSFHCIGPGAEFGCSRGKLVNLMMASSTEGCPGVGDRAGEFLILHVQREAYELSTQISVHQSRHSFLPEFFQGKFKSLPAQVSRGARPDSGQACIRTGEDFPCGS
jgi:hypothetical protein